MKRAILLIITVIFFIIMVSLQRVGAQAEYLPFTVEGVPWQEYQYRIDPVPRLELEPSCAEKWEAWDKLDKSVAYPSPVSLVPDCPRPEKSEPECYEKVFRLRFGSWVEATAVKRRFVYTLEADEKVLGITDNYLWLIRTLCEEAK